MDRTLRLIVNPAAGGGKVGRLLPQVIDLLHAKEAQFTTTFTRSLEHGAQLAEEAAVAGDVAVAMGGDGLVMSVVDAVVKSRPEAVVGIIPTGTGNDFGRWLGIRGMEGSVDALVKGRSRSVDVGKVQDRIFTCITSFGFDSHVIETAMKAKLLPGAAKYPYSVVRELLRWEVAEFEIEIDGVAHHLEGYNVVVANSGSYGGGMKVAPDADLEDGLFDIVVIGPLGKGGFLKQAPKVFWGGHIGHPAVQVWRGRKVKLAANRDFTVFADGEPIAPAPVEVEVLPRMLNVLVP